MEIYSVSYFFIGAFACTIGAIPFGLVNLSVVEATLKINASRAMNIAHGASVVEVLFALVSLLAGVWLSRYLSGSIITKFIVFTVLLFFGIWFWFKKNNIAIKSNKESSMGFFKGILLNLLSVQVLLFWLFTFAVLSAKHLLPSTLIQILLFISGVWLAKMIVLRLYAFLAVKVVSRATALSSNINRIIGAVLVSVSFIQLIKI